MKKDTVSIVIITKNEEVNIKRLLESIKNQTYNPIETIVVDNNSTDETKIIAKKYTSKVFNFGPERSAQRNLGAKKAMGKYLFFLDADMELTDQVVGDAVKTSKKGDLKAITIPEKTVGNGFVQRVRRFEREMYMGESDFEVPRFFAKNVFDEFNGYDTNLTGPEDYDLPYRMSKNYKLGRSHEYILHHEENLTLMGLLNKKYYYANKGANYALKHPKLVWIQGTILFRKVYIKNWRKFLSNPVLGIFFVMVRVLETIWSLAGFVRAVGIVGFLKVVFNH